MLPADDMSVHYDPLVDLPRGSGVTYANMFSIPLVLGGFCGDRGASCKLQALIQVQRAEFTQDEITQLEVFAGVVVAPMMYRC